MKLRHHVAVICAGACSLWSAHALADTAIIKLPGAHPDYLFEAEPHVFAAPFDALEPGIGFHGTFKIVDNGFIPRLNNSVGIGFGLDWSHDHFRIPIVMQWNFWLSRNWSVFGEPGGLMDFEKKPKPRPGIWAGARYHFTDRITLTLRIGHPTFSAGVSFLL